MKIFKNYKNVLGIIIIILAVVIAVVLLVSMKKTKDDDTNEIISNERIHELITNDFKYTYIYQGDIKTTDSYIEENGERYYYIEDEVISDIKTLEDIYKLVDNTFTKEKANLYYEKFQSNNKYLENDGKLYVKKGDGCINLLSYEDAEVSYEEKDEYLLIYWGPYYAYLHKNDDIWYMIDDSYHCLSDDELFELQMAS